MRVRAARALSAALVACLAVACIGPRREASPPSTQTPTSPPSSAPLSTQAMTASAVFQFRRLGAEATLDRVRAEADLDDASRTVVLVFPSARVVPTCLVDAKLRFITTTLKGLGSLMVYPSAMFALGTLRASHGRWNGFELLATTPSADVEITHMGETTVTTDVTDLLRLWLEGGPFQSSQPDVPAHTPLIVEVRPPEQLLHQTPTWAASIDATSAKAPTLTVVTHLCGSAVR